MSSEPSHGGVPQLAKEEATSATAKDEIVSPSLAVQEVSEALEPAYPTGIRLGLISVSLYLGGFLIALDGTGLGAVVPVISNEFHSLRDIGWYSSVYFIAMSTPQLVFNKLNERYSIRWNYSIAVFLFIIGSAICGAAPNSPVLIAGRTIAGLGAAGLLVATSSLLPLLVPPPKRPLWIGLFSVAMGLGLSCGPLIGGAFAQNVSWRWTFYINIPISAFMCGVFLVLVHPPAPVITSSRREFVQSLDLVGLVALTPAIVCLLLALQMGGTTYAWDSPRVISLFVLFGLFAVAFVASEIWQGDKAIVPARILAQRSIIWTVLYAFCTNSASAVAMYYLPIWLQGVKEFSPLQSGVSTLPQVFANITGSFLSGIFVTLFGHAGIMMALASVFTAVGAGLLTTLDVDAGSNKWIGYQMIFGLGSGICRQIPTVCVQYVLEPKDVPMGYTVMTFIQFISPAILVSVGQTVFANTLVDGLGRLPTSHMDPNAVLIGGINTIGNGLSAEAKKAALSVVSNAIVHTWRVCLALCCVSVIGACAVEHRKLGAKRKA